MPASVELLQLSVSAPSRLAAAASSLSAAFISCADTDVAQESALARTSRQRRKRFIGTIPHFQVETVHVVPAKAGTHNHWRLNLLPAAPSLMPVFMGPRFRGDDGDSITSPTCTPCRPGRLRHRSSA